MSSDERMKYGEDGGFVREVGGCWKVNQLEGVLKRFSGGVENRGVGLKVCLERLGVMKMVRRRLGGAAKCEENRENTIVVGTQNGYDERNDIALSEKELKEIERLKLGSVLRKSFKMSKVMARKFLLKKSKNLVINFIGKHD